LSSGQPSLGEGGKFGPLRAFESEEDFVEISISVFAAAKGEFHFGVDRQGFQDIFYGLIEKRVGDG
jgi:hypothetical protein